jgi:hypothetical protein
MISTTSVSLLELISVERMRISWVPFQATMAFCPASTTLSALGEKPPLSPKADESSPLIPRKMSQINKKPKIILERFPLMNLMSVPIDTTGVDSYISRQKNRLF